MTGITTGTISVIVPTFNSAPWLPGTIRAIERSLDGSGWKAEILVIDDGSTDDTQSILDTLVSQSKYGMRVITQENQGVFAARLRGAHASTYDLLLFVDSRVITEENALSHLKIVMRNSQAIRIGHVVTDPSAPLIGRFWEVPTYLFWGSYLRAPKLTYVTPDNFDSVPKGTGFLVVNRQEFIQACLEMGDTNGRFVSDDTKLLRRLSRNSSMVLDPEFRATYLPRTSFSRFIQHALLRGTLFVDSYYGTTRLRTWVLWLFAAAFPVVIILLASTAINANLGTLFGLLGLLLLGIVVMVGGAMRNHAPGRAVISFLTYLAPFMGVFWFGVCRGLYLRVKRPRHGK